MLKFGVLNLAPDRAERDVDQPEALHRAEQSGGAVSLRGPRLRHRAAAHHPPVPVGQLGDVAVRRGAQVADPPREVGAQQRRRRAAREDRQGQLWRRLQGQPERREEELPGGGEDLQGLVKRGKRCRFSSNNFYLTDQSIGDFAGRAKEEVSSGGKDLEAVRSSQHSPLHRHLRPEAAHHDRHGTRVGRQPFEFPQKSRRQPHTEESPG